MQQSRFVVLTGHLNDYPLGDLVGILRHQQKTGRLLIEYPKGPAMFYFNEGELVDAQLDRLSGLQAICVALAQPPSCFNFNPLIQPSRRSIESSRQKVISELLGCWDATGVEIETITPATPAAQPALLPSASHTFANSPDTTTTQALVISSAPQEASVSNYTRPILAMASAGLMMLGLSTVIAVSGGFGKRVSPGQRSNPPTPSTSPAAVTDPSARQNGGELSQTLPSSEPRNDSRIQRATKGKDPATLLEQSSHRKNNTFSLKKDQTGESKDFRSVSSAADIPLANGIEQKSSDVPSNTQSVKVVLQIEDGRVAEASIANHRSGMEAYEALAIRIARQRRYPSKAGGQETVVIKVNQPR
jgi:hypothetical protein